MAFYQGLDWVPLQPTPGDLVAYDTFYLENLLSLWSSIVNAAVTALLLAIMFLPERTLQCQKLPPGRSQYQPGPMRAGSPSWPLHHTCPVLVGTKTSSKCSVIIRGSASPLFGILINTNTDVKLVRAVSP